MSFEKAKADLEEEGLGDHVIVLNESSATVTGDRYRHRHPFRCHPCHAA